MKTLGSGIRLFAAFSLGAGWLAHAQGVPAPPPVPAPPRVETPASPPRPPSATREDRTRFSERPGPASATPEAGALPVVVEPGTHILLNMINSVSTKQAAVGDRIYLETAFPIVNGGRIIIPQGSWVTGTVTSVKRPGRVKGRGELQVHFDSLVLPNGVSRNFNGDLAAIDSRSDQNLKREGSKVTSPGNKSGDLGSVITTTTSGTVIGSGVGAAAGNVARGAGVGAGAGLAAGLVGTLLTRGPDATLTRGSTVEMVLDRPLTFSDGELDFSRSAPHGSSPETGAQPVQKQGGWLPSRSPF